MQGSGRVRTWLIVAAVAGLVVAAILVALPFAVRELAVRRVEAMTGRAASIEDVDLNLFARRIVFTGVRVTSPGEAPPLAHAPRIEARFRLGPLLDGRIHLDRLVLVEPSVRLVRHGDGALGAQDVVEHWRARPAGEPVRATLAELKVERARITFVDGAVRPAREWVLADLGIDARDIATVADGAAGRLSATFVIGGAPGRVHVEDLRVRPLQGRASVQVDGLDVAPFGAYVPADAPIRLAGGRFSSRLTVEYGARGLVRASGESAVRALVLARAGQTPAFITVPLLQLRATDVTYTGGAVAAGGLALAAAHATVLDASAPHARPLDVRDIRVTFDDARLPAGRPGRLSLTATLPGGGTLAARGTAAMLPPASDLSVDVRGLDVTLARMWLPVDAALTPAHGDVGATLAVRYARARGLTLDGRAWVTSLQLAARGQPAPVLREDRVEMTVEGFRLDDTGARLGRLRLAASPTIIVGPGSPPLHVPDVTVSASGGGVPGGEATQVAARIALPGGGRVTATGEVQLAARTARLSVVASDIDAMLAARYLRADAPVAIDRGHLDARLAVAWTGALDVAGRVTARDVTVRRRGDSGPMVEHGTLRAALTDLTVRDGRIALGRVTLTGSPTIVDTSASPPQRFELQRLELTAKGVTWPARGAMELEGHAQAADGGRATLTGTLHPATLATDVRLAFEGIDVTRARSYLAPSTPLTVESGRARGTAALRHTWAGGTALDAEGEIQDVALLLTAGGVVRVVDDRVAFAVEDLLVKDGVVAVDRAVIEGAPRVGRGDELGPAFALRAALAWPQGPPARLTVTASPGGGRIEIEGTFAPAPRTVRARVHAEDAALEPFAALLPIDAEVGGRLHARLDAALQPGTPVAATGTITVRDLRIGPEDTAPVRAETATADDITLEGNRLGVARITLTRPAILVEREEDGAFPLRAMLTPDSAGAAAPREATAGEPAAPWCLDVSELTIVNGAVRFLDRTTRPFYSEEITRLQVTVRDVSNTAAQHAGVSIQGIVGVDAALDLRGEIAPFASPFFMEVSGELRDFAVPRTNPYLQRFLDWIARRGQLTTKVHYRIVGDELRATNELVVHRLDVERARGGDGRAERLVGIPLGLAVALLEDAKGDIRFTLPVSGALSSPTFSFGNAVKRALSNVLGKLVTAPFKAIGSVFERDGRVEDVRIDPLTFPPGSAALTPDAAARLQRVADFLRASPSIRLGLRPVVSERDLRALKAREVTAHIQRVQREQQLDDFAEAARRVWRLSVTEGGAPPDDPQAVVTTLAEREPTPFEEARRLATRRESVTRTHLVDAAGIPGDRLLSDPGARPIGVDGAPRVEFDLQPGP